MIKAYLTIDDITSKNTKAIVDYLCEKKIQAVLFAWGKLVEQNYEDTLYALNKGMVIGNHSYSHLPFSELTPEEGILEIEKCEAILDNLYNDSGIKREYRLFRFPYDDKGKDNKDFYQKYLRDQGFCKLDDRNINIDFWEEYELHKDIDTFWTLDLGEYNIRPDSGFTVDDVIRTIDEYFNNISDEDSTHIIVLHSHDETEDMVPEYYKIFIDELINRGVVFISPEFI